MSFSFNSLSRERSEELTAWGILLDGPPSSSYESQPDVFEQSFDLSSELSDSNPVCTESDHFALESDGINDANTINSESGNDANAMGVLFQEESAATNQQVAVGEKRVDRCEDRAEEARRATKLRRGEHVKGRTKMQENARHGQRHWANRVRELRAEWEAKEMERFNLYKEFDRQLFLCQRLHVKPQRECILLALQMATVDGIIQPLLPFNGAHDSLGWSGFCVVASRSEEFGSRMHGLFPSDCSTTRNNTFRRCGLVAHGCWTKAWRGLSPFVYHPTQSST